MTSDRRAFLALSAAALFAPATARAQLYDPPNAADATRLPPAAEGDWVRDSARFRTDDRQMAMDSGGSTRMQGADPTGRGRGFITVDTRARKLYYSLGGGEALIYGVGVGRDGFRWKGLARIGRKAEWPAWTPTPSMVRRRPDLPRWMDGGIENPLGARALYIYDGARDTMLRIHGTNEPDSIGHAVSSGCIRMMNRDVIDLFERAPIGSPVLMI